MKEQKNLYYILGKVFMYEEEVDDKDNTKIDSDIINVEHKTYDNSLDVTPKDNFKADESYTIAEYLKPEDLSEKEHKEEKEGVQEIEEIEEIEVIEVIEVIKIIEVIKEIEKNEKIEKIEKIEGVDIMAVSCGTGLDPNCGECCTIFTDSAKRTAFGYQVNTAACECHDICVEDVRDICVKERTLTYCIPCNPDGRAGCRGGFLPDGPPAIQSWRVLCGDENLSPATGCDRIINNIEFEVVLRYSSAAGSTLVVVTPKDIITCFWHEFAKFPSGTFYPNNATGLNQFRNELAQIDGSCKVIIIENVRVGVSGNDCMLFIDYKVIDKLWKHENLLVSAIKPYVSGREIDNITVSQEFAQGHLIGPCTGSGPCSGLAIN